MAVADRVRRLAVLLGLLWAASAAAVTIDDGDYAYLPDGSKFGVVYVQHFEGRGLYAKGQQVASNARLSADVVMLRGVWFLDWGNDYGVVPQFLQPMGTVRTGGALAGADATNGMGDLVLVCPLHLIKDPTGRDAFALTPWLWLPTGHYDRNNALNPFAENRWKFAAQAGRIWKVSEAVSFELLGDVTVYGKNDDFGPAGATLRQHPLRELQAHTRYFLTPGTFVGGMVAHVWGGETQVNGIHLDDRQSLTKVLFTLAGFVTPDVQLMLSVGRDVAIRTGVREDSRVNFRFLRVFK